MSVQTAVSADPRVVQLQQVWVECFRSVLCQVAGFPVTVEPANEEEAAKAEPAGDKTPVWAVITASKALQGQMAILTTQFGALPFAQILVSEAPDPAVAFDKERQDAYEEFLRQVLGLVATNLKSVAGGEVELKLLDSVAPSWEHAGRLGIRIAGEKLPAVDLVLVVSPELEKSLQPPPQASAPPPTPKTNQPTPPQPELSPERTSNLELLLDVKLDATIRFGEKHLRLREILELHAGTAVALDRQIEEPVELLVGGRTVARGEVVIVDGNYGLRITEILSPQQRIESLKG